jgi:hypothetical protein
MGPKAGSNRYISHSSVGPKRAEFNLGSLIGRRDRDSLDAEIELERMIAAAV